MRYREDTRVSPIEEARDHAVCFALIAFVVLLGFGISMEELTWLHAGLCLVFAAAVLVAFAAFQWPFILYFVGLALTDVVLVIVVFKGDIQIR